MTRIHVVKIQNDTDSITNIQQEIFKFGSNSGLNSGLFDTLTEAQQFAREIINNTFISDPDKQYCFEIYSNTNIVGCAWLRDNRSPESPG